MTLNSLQWKIGGEAGFGIMTTGMVFSKICTRGGLKTFAYPEYPSLIRGGHNTYQVRVDAEQATSQIKTVHLLAALNKETVELHLDELADDAAVVYDPKDFGDDAPEVGKNMILVPVPMIEITKEQKVDKVARNTIAIGASFGLLDYPWETVEAVISDWFGKKKPELAEANIKQARAGYDAAAGKYSDYKYKLEPQTADLKKGPEQMVISGNGASALGAIKAGMKFYAAYPMTPSSDFLSYFAKKEIDYNLVVKHTEDEIAAMNMIIGAGYAGVRAMTATSGGGFALMTEALGMAGIAEVPVVTVVGQRPGPSTGLPTWSSQGDLRFVVEASQGEFPYIVLAPGDVEECFYMTHEAFNLAEKYQTPVVILIDKYNQASWQSVEPFDVSKLEIDRGKLMTQKELDKAVKKDGEYLRHKYTDDGISPRVVPGMKNGRHIASSYEHEESGYTTESESETIKQYDKRFKKMEKYLAEDATGPEFYGPENAEVTVVGWGSTKLPAMEMLRMAEAEGVSVNYLHFKYIHPLPVKEVEVAFSKTKKRLSVEANKLGQLEGYIREYTGLEMDASFRKYGGRPFYPEEMLVKAKELL